jgi:gluconolactonase
MGVDGEVIATGLRFPEGPVWQDGALLFTEINGGAVSRWAADGGVSGVATTGGGPNGAALGPDGAVWVTQNGGMTPEQRATAGIQRIEPDASVAMAFTSVGGVPLDGPNDLAFGPDGRLWFTDPRGAADASNDKPGRLFAVDVATGDGDLVLEVGPVFPNGIAFLADGTLVWTESFSRRVMALVGGDSPEPLIELPERHFPDGLCVGADGRLYVASTYAHCVSVVEGGEIVDRLLCGDGMPTNCCFGGTDLYVTESRHGTLWRFPLDRKGLDLPYA